MEGIQGSKSITRTTSATTVWIERYVSQSDKVGSRSKDAADPQVHMYVVYVCMYVCREVDVLAVNLLIC